VFVTWEQLREMAKAGATIANHSSSHAHFPLREKSESAAQWRERITQETNNAQQKIKTEIGFSPMILAYPFGGSFTDLDDFILKVNSMPMPVSEVEFFCG